MNSIPEDQKEFYEDYWKQRKREGHLHTEEDMRAPKRIEIARDMIIEDLEDRQENTVTILDVGCGEGALGKLLKERLKDGATVVGCDISDSAIEEASKYYSDCFQVDFDKCDLGHRFAEKEFDCIVLLEVLEHLFEPGNILKQCCSILKDDGILVASFPNIAWYRYRIDMLKGNFPRGYCLLSAREHIQNFTLRSFLQLLKDNKFEPVRTDGQFIGPRNLGLGKFFKSFMRKFPGLFGYQIVIKSRKAKEEDT